MEPTYITASADEQLFCSIILVTRSMLVSRLQCMLMDTGLTVKDALAEARAIALSLNTTAVAQLARYRSRPGDQ